MGLSSVIALFKAASTASMVLKRSASRSSLQNSVR